MPSSPGKPGKKKHYRPPQADANTFETQKDFLESLQPVPLDSVPEKSRKCAHCWKQYGESDPGLDNAEEPVRFRCNHVFGEKCMKDLFGLPESIRVLLVQLSFEPGSKGAELGQKLSAYIDKCGVDKGALLTGGRREKDFARLLGQVDSLEGVQNLGVDWNMRFQHALSPHRLQIQDVHVLENGFVFDVISPDSGRQRTQSLPAKTSALVAPPLFANPFDFHSISSPSGGALILGSTTPVGVSQGQHLYEAAVKAASETSSSSSSSSTSKTGAGALPPGFHAAGFDTTLEDAQHSLVASLLASSSDSESSDDTGMNAYQDKESSASMSIDHVVKLPKQASAPMAEAKTSSEQASDAMAETEAKELKFQEVLKQLGDPTLAPFLPFPQGELMAEALAVGPKAWTYTYQLESLPTYNPEPDLDKSQKTLTAWLGGKESNLQSQSKSQLGTTTPEKIKYGTWKDTLPEQTVLDKLVALKQKLKTATEALKHAQHEKSLQKVQQEKAQARAAKLKEEREARKKEITSVLARSLARIYKEFEQFQYNAAVAAGQPPPIKKMKLASKVAKPLTSLTEPALPVAFLSQQIFVHVAAYVHIRDVNAKHYDVPQPYIFPVYSDDEEDEGDGETQSADLSKKHIMLTRTICQCCGQPGAEHTALPLPDFVSWKDSRNVPDGCPVCQRVLFKKEAKAGPGIGGGMYSSFY